MKRPIVIFLSMIFLGTSLSSVAKTVGYGQIICKNPDLSCVKVQRGETWENLFPDESQRDLVRRLNRTNEGLYPGEIIAVPKSFSHDVMDIAPFSKQITAPGEKLIIFNPEQLAWGAYDENGKLVRWGPAAGGKSWCPDIGRSCRTAPGDFRVYAKQGVDCISTKYPIGEGGAPMPYCMFFNGGYALHGSPQVPGYHASHGCVRLFVEDAAWLNQEFINLPSKGQGGTKVIVEPYASD